MSIKSGQLHSIIEARSSVAPSASINGDTDRQPCMAFSLEFLSGVIRSVLAQQKLVHRVLMQQRRDIVSVQRLVSSSLGFANMAAAEVVMKSRPSSNSPVYNVVVPTSGSVMGSLQGPIRGPRSTNTNAESGK